MSNYAWACSGGGDLLLADYVRELLVRPILPFHGFCRMKPMVDSFTFPVPQFQ